MPACVSYKLRVTFERIGQHRDIPPLDLVNDEEIVEAVTCYALRFMKARTVDVAVNLDAMCGTLGGGWFGAFSISELL